MEVKHTEGRFFVSIDGKEAELLYKKENNIMDLYHTFTPEELRGKGIAEILTNAAFEFAKQHNLKIRPSCSYVKDVFLKKHPEWMKIVEG